MQKTAGLMGDQFGAPTGILGQQQPDPASGELPYNMSQTTARYLHDMKIEKEEIQARLDQSRGILEIELRKFKRYMVQ